MIQLGPRQYVEGDFEFVDDAGNLAQVEEGSFKYLTKDVGLEFAETSEVVTVAVTGSNPFHVTVDYKAAGATAGKPVADADLGAGVEPVEGNTEDFTCTPAKASQVRGSFGEVKTRA